MTDGTDPRFGLLSEATRAFAAATSDYERLLGVVAQRVAQIVKDGCVVRLLDADGWLRPAAIEVPLEGVTSDPEVIAQLKTHIAGARRLADHEAGRSVIETGQALLVPRLDLAAVRASASPAVAAAFETLGVHSMLMLGLRARGESLGLMTLVRYASQEPFGEADRDFAQTLADQAAFAMANAQLIRRLEERDQQQMIVTRDNELLARIGDELRVASDDDIFHAIATHLGTYLKATRCSFVEVHAPEDLIITHREYRQAHLRSMEGRLKLSAFSESTKRDSEAGLTVVNRDTKVDVRTKAVYEAAYAPLAARATLSVPVRRGRAWVATLTVAKDEPYEWQAREINLVQVVAERTWAWVEHLRTVATIRESAERFRALVEASAQLVWTTTPSGEGVEDSPTWRSFTGQTIEQWLGWGRLDAVHPDDRERVLATWRAAHQTTNYFEMEYRLRRRDGEWRWTFARAAPMFDPNGRIRGWVKINTDITDRRHTEDRFRIALEAAPTGMLLLGPDGRIALVNSEIERLFGYVRDDLVGRSIEMLVPDRFRTQHSSHRQGYVAAPQSRRMSGFVGLRKDGSELPIDT